jgi:hypothetical protein
MARSGVNEPTEVRALTVGIEVGLPRGEAQDKVGERQLILEHE